MRYALFFVCRWCGSIATRSLQLKVRVKAIIDALIQATLRADVRRRIDRVLAFACGSAVDVRTLDARCCALAGIAIAHAGVFPSAAVRRHALPQRLLVQCTP